MSYRDTPEDIEYREREHHPICGWCKHFNEGSFVFAIADMCEKTTAGRYMGGDTVQRKNGLGQCDNYAPSLSTRVRQLVKLRPFVTRIREGIVSQTPEGRVDFKWPPGVWKADFNL